MPYRIVEQDGQFCIIKHAPDGSPIGEPLYCHDTRGEAEDQMSALYAAETQSNVKAVIGGDEWALDVRGVPFDGPLGGKDTHGEFFDPETDLWLDGRTELPVVHYHGMRERHNDEVEIIGKAVRWWKEADGWWFRVLLDKASNTAAKIWQAAKEGYARASSGATYHLTRSDKRTGRIKLWPLGELSLMDSRQYKPANDYAVALPAYKADEQSLQFVYERAGIPWPVFSEGSVEPPAGGTSTKEAGAGVGSDHPNQPRNNIMDLEQLMEIIRAALAPVIGTAVDEMKQMGEGEPDPENPDQQPPIPEELKMDGDQVDKVSQELLDQVAAKAADILKKDSGFKQVTPETAESWVKGVLDQHAETLMQAAFDARFSQIMERREMAAKAGRKALERFQKNAPAGAAKADAAGGVSKPAPDANGNGRGANITGVRNLKYAALSAEEMAVGIMMARAPLKTAGLNPDSIIRENFSEEYFRHLAVKAAKFADGEPLKDPKENYALKASLPFKSDEIMATNISGQGTEWVPNFYSTQLWERARNTRIYQMLLSKGMMVEELSNEPGSTAYFPTEGADPTVYTGVEANDLASGRVQVTASVQSLGTGQVSVSPKELKTAVAVTVTMDEDSIIATAPQVNRQLNEVMEDTIEQLMINGDTETGASANINLIDGTPASGVLTTPYYIATNGFLKLALITAPAASVTSARDAQGTLDIYDTLNTKKLYDTYIRAKLAKLAFILDPDTHDAHLALPQLTTSDVAARFATIQTGVIEQLWGIDVLVSGFMALANSAGKIPSAGGSLGRILSIYAPYWGLAWKRQITLETDRDILAGASLYVASMRMGVVARGNDAARVTYNVGVTI